MPFVTVRDIQMYYEMRGEGPRLLSISGTAWDLRRSPTIFETPLPQQFEILAYDQRGLGQTSRPDIPYTMADYAADADGLLEAVGWDRCPVIGVSFGGMVAQELALSCPHRVERLVLACTGSGGAGGASYPLHDLAEFSLEDRARRRVIISDTRLDPSWRIANPTQFQELVNEMVMIAKSVPVGSLKHAQVTIHTIDSRAYVSLCTFVVAATTV
jgi:3-oxoadipate enol-lactonase